VLPERGPLAERLTRLIETSGPIKVADYMALANAHYYGTRDPLGGAGDFVTAPEISQMFGELVGLCLADSWRRAGRPDGTLYIELGPGRGTLAADALRAMRNAGLSPEVHFIETSPVLRQAQAERVPQAHWHDDLSTIPDGPSLVVANEFFDALPARQLVATESGWRERLVRVEDGRFAPAAGPPVPDGAIPAHLRAAPPATILETSPASLAVIRLLAHRLSAGGGAALIVDYGHVCTSAGETLQAVRGHAYTDPWQEPGESDLTVHVDFQALAAAAAEAGVRVLGPVGQGPWLSVLGIEARAAALARSAPQRAEEIEAARHRLVAPDQMGTLFKVMALASPSWPDPAGVHMLTYRDAVPADAPVLADLFRRAFIETFGHLYRAEDLEFFLAGMDQTAWRGELANPSYRIYVVEADGEAIGFAKLGPLNLPVEPEGKALELKQLYLLREWHGRGIARVLMDWTLDQAQRQGAEALYLSVWTENFRARNFYARYGFTFVAPYAFMVGEQADEDEIWVLQLKDEG
jgi:NADH dehydrogenase [ubiquinone] 1 alpha subcomplex assembly factor 7